MKLQYLMIKELSCGHVFLFYLLTFRAKQGRFQSLPFAEVVFCWFSLSGFQGIDFTTGLFLFFSQQLKALGSQPR